MRAVTGTILILILNVVLLAQGNPEFTKAYRRGTVEAREDVGLRGISTGVVTALVGVYFTGSTGGIGAALLPTIWAGFQTPVIPDNRMQTVLAEEHSSIYLAAYKTAYRDEARKALVKNTLIGGGSGWMGGIAMNLIFISRQEE